MSFLALRTTVGIMFFCGAIAYADTLTVAVIELQGKNMSQQHASILTDKLQSELFEHSAWKLMEREQVAEILKEQGFQQTGCTSKSCAVEMGQMIGVGYLVTGSVGKLENVYYISLRMVDVAHGSIEKSVDAEIVGSMSRVLREGIPTLARQLAGIDASAQTETGDTRDKETENEYVLDDEAYYGKTKHSLLNIAGDGASAHSQQQTRKDSESTDTRVLNDSVYYGKKTHTSNSIAPRSGEKPQNPVQEVSGSDKNEGNTNKSGRKRLLSGFKAGYSGSDYYSMAMMDSGWNIDAGNGFHFGGVMLYSFSSDIYIQAEMLFGSRDGGYARSGNMYSMDDSLFMLQQQYVRIVPALRLDLPTGVIKPMVMLGPVFSFITSSEIRTDIYLPDVAAVQLDARERKFEFGIRAEGGIAVLLGGLQAVGTIGVDVGLTPVLVKDSDDMYSVDLDENPLMDMRALELFVAGTIILPL